MSDEKLLTELKRVTRDINERLVPVNELLDEAKNLGCYFNIHEGYDHKKDSPTVSIGVNLSINRLI